MQNPTRLTGISLLVAVILAALCGCAGDGRPQLEVLVRVTMCVDNGADCFALGVPSAEVTVEEGGRILAEGETDQSGAISLRLESAQLPMRLIARSPLIDGGMVEAMIPPFDGTTSSTLGSPLDEAVRPT